MKLLCLLLLCLSASAREPISAVRLRYERTSGDAIITGHGTAFGVAKRYLLTAKHNVLDEKGNPYKTLKIEIDGEWRKCSVAAFDEVLDVCVLKSSADAPVFELAESDALEGAKVDLQGSPRGIPILNRCGVLKQAFDQGILRLCARLEFDHGDSGGPLLVDGKVIGMAVSGVPKDGDIDKTTCVYLPVSALRKFIQEQLRK